VRELHPRQRESYVERIRHHRPPPCYSERLSRAQPGEAEGAPVLSVVEGKRLERVEGSFFPLKIGDSSTLLRFALFRSE